MLLGNALIICTMLIYVTDQVSDTVLAANFLNSFRQAKPHRLGQSATLSTPNDRPRGPPKTSDDERVDQLCEEVRKGFEKHLQKEKTHDVSSASESEQPKKKPIQAKAMPTPPPPPQRRQKGTARTVSSSSAKDERRSPVRGSAARRGTSTQAKELFKDADAAKKLFTKFKQETEAIEWYQRSPGPQCCKNIETCNAEEAMFWCHPCGLAYCLSCRAQGLACNHHITNYSSEISSDFMPDSIGSKDSPFDVGAIIDSVLLNPHTSEPQEVNKLKRAGGPCLSSEKWPETWKLLPAEFCETWNRRLRLYWIYLQASRWQLSAHSAGTFS